MSIALKSCAASTAYGREERLMIELVRSNDLIFLSWLTMCLEEEAIELAALNERMAIGHGSIPAIKHRVMFDDG